MKATSPRIAVYPGSFDPITRGHEDIVRRALRFADRVVVAVAYRATQPKAGLFTIPERLEMMREVFADEARVEVDSFSGLLVEYAGERGADVVVRGLRAVSDFDYEFQMALMNRRLRPDVETLFLAPDAQYSFLSASLVREIAGLGGDVSEFVTPAVRARLAAKFRTLEA
jgi:pantetheine-phosphate adenylyltransferase